MKGLETQKNIEYFTPAELNETLLTYDGVSLKKGGKNIKEGIYIFVVDGNGKIFVTEPEIGKIHHSSFFHGGPVAAAGKMYINNDDKKITALDSHSGHYQPSPKIIDVILAELRLLGYPIKEIMLMIYNQKEHKLFFKPAENNSEVMDGVYFDDKTQQVHYRSAKVDWATFYEGLLTNGDDYPVTKEVLSDFFEYSRESKENKSRSRSRSRSRDRSPSPRPRSPIQLDRKVLRPSEVEALKKQGKGS